jgi:hypothetical protein
MIVGDGFPIVAIAPSRNSKCACKSGKKTKNCCGTNTRFFSTKPKVKERVKTDGDGNPEIVNGQ